MRSTPGSTDEVNAWLDHLLENDADTHRQLVSAVYLKERTEEEQEGSR
jgi:formiminotetrahydrofolate cyclodeaminase